MNQFGFSVGFHLECATTAKKQQHVVAAILAVVVAVAGGAEVEVIEAIQMESLCFFRYNYFYFLR